MFNPNQKPDAIWVYPKTDPTLLKKIIDEFNIHPVTGQILISRGFTALEKIHAFLYAKLPNLHSPALFNDMNKAVSRCLKTISAKEAVLIYGDNDVDGMTATALLTEFFTLLQVPVFYYVPSSTTQKKNMMIDALQYALKNNCKLLITVDCGITAFKEIQSVVKEGIDVIVTDHHEPTSKIPSCIATLNPKLVNSTYPNRDICGVGVAFKLAHAITNQLIQNGDIEENTIDLKQFLDLVALGTIADMGSLLGENRIFVRYGLQQMRKTKRIGLIQLFSICDLKINVLTPVDIASKIAPRLNSLGRIADPAKGVQLLLIQDEKDALNLAKELDLHNLERQKIERIASEDIERFIHEHPRLLHDKAIVLSSNKWHPGIIPIITARITKQYNRPSMLIAVENGIGKGSIRTIPEFPLLGVLKEAEELLINFGGHDYAAGLTLAEENIAKLKKHFIKAANDKLQEKDVIAKLYLDAPIDFNELTFDFMESLRLLEPYGNENPAPVLYTDAKQNWQPKIVGHTHLKFYLEQNDRILEGIGFGMAFKREQLRKKNLKLRVAFTPHINTFLNQASIQLQIRDFKPLSEEELQVKKNFDYC
ncbi:MAG: single-stranded-DNA-specific exonuclease RecJ [Parachlamydiales bacterium]|jgi:single-stranded-DNA-specific exonuclease